ncbi:hypothetical protein [Providencia rustigianii]|uniref:hypothetical protein n=1 Tax=Providencia rustigianii TaxID=158850 RepID=UPI00223F8899|nr:hypothetical protein [Providencia rustigianii]
MDKSRQQFEEWFKKEYPLIESQPENTLLQSVKRQCLKAWQASRESLINNLEPTGYIDNAEFSELNSSRICYLYKDSIDKINIPLYRLDK